MISLKNAWVTQEEIAHRENKAKEEELAKQNQAEEFVALKTLVQQTVQVNNALAKILVTSPSLSQEEKETFINSFQKWEKDKIFIQGTIVQYKGKLYESLVDNNMKLPTDKSNWKLLS